MGNTASREEIIKKSRAKQAYTLSVGAKQAYTLSVGSEVERLFYEDFDKDAKDIKSASAIPALSKQNTNTSENKWAPVQAPTPVRHQPVEVLLPLLPAAAPDLGLDQSVLRRAVSDPGKGPSAQPEGTPLDSTYSTGDERWKERMRRRIADRIASDQRKSTLSQFQLPSELETGREEIEREGSEGRGFDR